MRDRFEFQHIRYRHGGADYPRLPEVGEEDVSILIPEEICEAIGLDREANYVRVSEINQFQWPSDRLSPLPHDNSRCDYGMVPERFFLDIRKRLAETVRAKRLKSLKVD